MRNIIYITIVGSILIAATALWQSNPKVENVEVIKIGVISPFSGFLASVGEDVKSGVQDAEHDGIEYIFEDDACDNTKALSAFKKLVEFDKVHFIIGPGCGGPQEVITPLLKNKEVIVIVPSAATEDLHERSGGNLYNMQYAIEDESEFIAKSMYEKGYKRVALIHYANAFSDVHTKTFKKYYKGDIVVDSLILSSDSDVSVELLKIKNTGVDAIVSTDVSFFFAQGTSKMKTFSMNTPVFSNYVTEIPAARTMVEGVMYSFPKEITNDRGAIYGLSKQSAQFLSPLVKKCSGEYSCVKKLIEKSGEFNNVGVKKRELVWKKIVNGKPVNL